MTTTTRRARPCVAVAIVALIAAVGCAEDREPADQGRASGPTAAEEVVRRAALHMAEGEIEGAMALACAARARTWADDRTALGDDLARLERHDGAVTDVTATEVGQDDEGMTEVAYAVVGPDGRSGDGLVATVTEEGGRPRLCGVRTEASATSAVREVVDRPHLGIVLGPDSLPLVDVLAVDLPEGYVPTDHRPLPGGDGVEARTRGARHPVEGGVRISAGVGGDGEAARRRSGGRLAELAPEIAVARGYLWGWVAVVPASFWTMVQAPDTGLQMAVASLVVGSIDIDVRVSDLDRDRAVAIACDLVHQAWSGIARAEVGQPVAPLGCERDAWDGDQA